MEDTPELTVLVVEDEWIVRGEIADSLRDAGYTVLEAASGETALGYAERAPIDVLVTDIRLGGRLTGWDVGEALRAAFPEVGVIYCSGESFDQGRAVAGSRVFDKPYRSEAIVDACRSMGNGHRRPH